ncbi:hypothetical protein ACA081_00715 [Candidatus Hodgkinia cicadicola]
MLILVKVLIYIVVFTLKIYIPKIIILNGEKLRGKAKMINNE